MGGDTTGFFLDYLRDYPRDPDVVRRMATFARNDEPMVAPSLVTRRWCKSRLIAYAKSLRSA